MGRILAELYPNGELRVRYKNILGKKKARDSVSRLDAKFACDKAFRGHPLDNKNEFQEKKFCEILKEHPRLKGLKPGWGMTPRLTRFGRRGRNKILRAGGAIDSLGGVNAAITMTLPGNTPQAMQVIADYSGFIANRVKTWVYDQMPDPSKVAWFYVWELQKRGALHMHICVNCQDMKLFRHIRSNIKAQWIKILESVGERSGVNMFMSHKGYDWRRRRGRIQVDCQKVRHSVSAYFAKYCSKQDKGTEENISKGLRPSRWWGCSRFLSRLTMAMRKSLYSFEMSQSQADELIRGLGDALDSVDKWYMNANPYSNEVYIIAYPGNELGLEIMEELGYRFGRNKSSLIEANNYMDNALRKRVNKLRRRWNSLEERLRLAEIFGTDSREWELYVYLMLESDCITNEMINHLLEIVENEGNPQVEAAEPDSDFYIPVLIPTEGL